MAGLPPESMPASNLHDHLEVISLAAHRFCADSTSCPNKYRIQSTASERGGTMAYECLSSADWAAIVALGLVCFMDRNACTASSLGVPPRRRSLCSLPHSSRRVPKDRLTRVWLACGLHHQPPLRHRASCSRFRIYVAVAQVPALGRPASDF